MKARSDWTQADNLNDRDGEEGNDNVNDRKRKTTAEATEAPHNAWRAAGKIVQPTALWLDWHSPNRESQERMQIFFHSGQRTSSA
jgi:hypothetical protein